MKEAAEREQKYGGRRWNAEMFCKYAMRGICLAAGIFGIGEMPRAVFFAEADGARKSGGAFLAEDMFLGIPKQASAQMQPAA